MPESLSPVSVREKLNRRLEEHYRGQGWPVVRSDDGVLHASGPGGVTWLGAAIVGKRIVDLAERRMPKGGELCPLDLLASEDSESGLRELLERTGLSARPHVSVYSEAA
jgi:hypothetical protein